MGTQSGVKLLDAFVWTRDQVARQREGSGMFGSFMEIHEVYRVDIGAKKSPKSENRELKVNANRSSVGLVLLYK